MMHDSNASTNVETLYLKSITPHTLATRCDAALHAQYVDRPAYESMHEQEIEKGSLREAAALCSSKKNGNVHVGAAIMPDYLNAHYDPYSSVLNRGMICTNTAVHQRVPIGSHHMLWLSVAAAIMCNTRAAWHTSDTRR